MARIGILLLVCGLAFGWLHAGEKSAEKEAPKALENYPPDVTQSMRVRIPVKKTETVNRIIDGVVQQTKVTKTTVAEQPIPVPTSEEEIQKLRDELKAFRQQQIDALEVETLVRQVYEEREAAREKEAWTKLEEVRKTLESLENEYGGTKAGDVSRQLQGQIPNSMKEAGAESTYDPFGGRKPNSSGTAPAFEPSKGAIPFPRDSVKYEPLFKPDPGEDAGRAL